MNDLKKLSRDEMKKINGGSNAPVDKCDVVCDDTSGGKEISDCSAASVKAACGSTTNATCSCH